MSSQYTIDPGWASVIIAGVLALITFWQMMEARRLRFESAKPALSLMPETYVIGGPFSTLFLVNNGGLARNLQIEVTHAGEKRVVYIMCLAENDRLRVVENAKELSDKGGELLVHVTYTDSYGKKHQDNLEVDFDQLKQGMFPYVSNRLDDLSESLRDIERRLSRFT